MSLTKRQRKILDFVKEFSETRGYAPSLMEIARQFGLRSPATVHKHLRNLEAKGALRRRWNHSRAIEVLPEAGSSPSFDLPLAGIVSDTGLTQEGAGAESVAVPAGLVGDGHTYVLRVRGDGFESALIGDGDLLVVHETATPPEGAVALAMVGGSQPAIGQLRRTDERDRLLPVSGKGADLVTAPTGELRIMGRVLGVLRQY